MFFFLGRFPQSEESTVYKRLQTLHCIIRVSLSRTQKNTLLFYGLLIKVVFCLSCVTGLINQYTHLLIRCSIHNKTSILTLFLGTSLFQQDRSIYYETHFTCNKKHTGILLDQLALFFANKKKQFSSRHENTVHIQIYNHPAKTNLLQQPLLDRDKKKFRVHRL